MTSVANSLESSAAFRAQVNARGFSDFAAGQIVNAKVLERLNEQRYVVLLRGEVREVQSENHLPVGASIDAVVVSATDKLVLRQLTAANQSAASPTGSILNQSPPLLNALDDANNVAAQADFYKLKLGNSEQRILRDAVKSADDPGSMMLAGLFLSKRGLPVEFHALNQLYAAQKQDRLPGIISDETRKSVSHGNFATIGALAQAMHATVDVHSGEMTRIAGSRDAQSDKHVAWEMTASMSDAATALTVAMDGRQTQDDLTRDGKQDAKSLIELHELLSDMDTNGLGVRYGTLPVLINGELVELELVMFKHRQQESDSAPIQRLIMSIHTEALGTVSITAESLNRRLLMTISAETTDHAETLGAYASDVHALAERFGWAVESVAYDVRTQGAKLAQRVMQHAIRQGVIDHVW